MSHHSTAIADSVLRSLMRRGVNLPAQGMALINHATGHRLEFRRDFPSSDFRFGGLCPGDYYLLAIFDVAGEWVEVSYDADGDSDADPVTLIPNACPLDLSLQVPADAFDRQAQAPEDTETPIPPAAGATVTPGATATP